jgi:hypothetical protein
VEKLMRAKYQDNLENMQWFKVSLLCSCCSVCADSLLLTLHLPPIPLPILLTNSVLL